MSSLNWFGHWRTWALILGAWGGLGLLTALALGVIARVGAWRGNNERSGDDDTR